MTKKRGLILALIFAAAALARFYGWYAGEPLGARGGDEPDYIAFGRLMAKTGELRLPAEVSDNVWSHGHPGDYSALREPFLPAFLAAHFRIFGPENLVIPTVSLILLSSLACVLIALIAQELGLAGLGLIAAGLWAVWPPAVIGPYSGYKLVGETPGLLLLLAHTYVLLLALRGASPLLAACSGLLLGLAALARGYCALYLALVNAFLLVLRRCRPDRVMASFLIGSALLPGYWVVRNWVLLGSPMLATHTFSFYVGNNRWARGSYLGDFYELGRRAPQLKVLESRHPGMWRGSEMELAKIWSRGAREELLLQGPRRLLWLFSRKAMLYWSPLQLWSARRYHYHWLYLLCVLALPLGAWRLIQREPFTGGLILLPILAGFVQCLIVYYMDRYRFIYEPYFILAALSALPLKKA